MESWCCSREWVWNLRRELFLVASWKKNVLDYNIFGILLRFCVSVNYFENMNPFADKIHFTDQNL